MIQHLAGVLHRYRFVTGRAGRPFLLLSWLVLGGLLAAPFMEILLFVQNLAMFILNPFAFPSPPEAGYLFGVVPWRFEILYRLLQTTLVYALVLWVGLRYYRIGRLGFLDQAGLDRVDRAAILLVFAALVHGVVERVVFSTIAILAPAIDVSGFAGYIIGWAAMILVLMLMATTLAQRLGQTELLEGEKW